MSESKYNLKRSPIVAVMGHVDHGKTTLLDSIRNTNVTEGEAGGITQNTRAHEVNHNGQKITFIDTPGHEAFSDMRSRGAKVTDIVVLVVAADDAVQPQTIESIKFAKKSKTPIVVAINKMDAPGADAAKVKNQLSQHDVLVEDYGGDVQTFEISALKKEGLEELLDGLFLQSEMLELKLGKSDYGKAHALVLESKLDNKLGAVALCLIKSGQIKVGEYIAHSEDVSKIRAILDEHQNNLEVGEESAPVWIVGLNEVVPTGTEIYFAEDDKSAKKLQKTLEDNERVQSDDGENESEEKSGLALLASLVAKEQSQEEIKTLNVVVRADTQGTLEVVESELKSLNTDEVEVNVLSSGTGSITRKDILTAKTARGIVLGFQVTVPNELDQIIKEEKVLVRIYSIIYELIEEVSDALDSLLEPEEYEEEIARAEIKKVFTLSNGQKVAGCVVTEGKVLRGYRVWVEREEEEIGRGRISSLKQNKDEVKEINKGSDCGIMIEPAVDFEEGDDVVLYKVEKN